jgi:hypothetical protein
VLGLSDRQASNLLNDWVEAGWLEVSDRSRKTRAYRLSENYRQYIGTITVISMRMICRSVPLPTVHRRR